MAHALLTSLLLTCALFSSSQRPIGAINSAVQSGGDALAVADCLLAVAADLINARRPLARHAAAAMRAKASEAYLYRAANTAEVAEAVRKNTLVPAFGARGALSNLVPFHVCCGNPARPPSYPAVPDIACIPCYTLL